MHLAEFTCFESESRFCRSVIVVSGKFYLRALNEEDIARILAHNSAKGFPGMLGSIECMH
jgi:hypothetical protein